MIEDWKIDCSERAHRAAEAWGMDVLPGRPLVCLCTYDVEIRGIKGVVGNPYQPNMAPTVERHSVALPKSLGAHSQATVRLFTFNDRWGFSTDYFIESRGHSYGNWITSSNPYPSRDDALLAGVQFLAVQTKTTAAGKYVEAWMEDLAAPRQLELFHE